MSIGFFGLDTPCCMQPVTIEVSPTHPFIQLAHVIPWQALADMVLPDLQRTTTKGTWWLGRKLTLRIHLGVLLLQWLYHLTDRQVEWAIRDNAAYQLFCGRGLRIGRINGIFALPPGRTPRVLTGDHRLRGRLEQPAPQHRAVWTCR